MVRLDVVGQKIARATAWLADAELLLDRPVAEFMADTKDRDLAAFYIFLAIQESIDLAAHWISDAGWEPPDDAGSLFGVLADRGAMDRELAEQLHGAVGLRNRIAHGYATVDHARIHGDFSAGAAALRRFLTLVAAEAASR